MGRLIEAETLKASVRAKFPNVADRCEINELINAAPTVDAIPVAWLREFDLYYAGISGGSPYMKELIEVWQKEQEAKT